jgi:biopolymer transport protein ExbD
VGIARRPLQTPSWPWAGVNLALLVMASLLVAMVGSLAGGLDVTLATASPSPGGEGDAAAIEVLVRADGGVVVDGELLALERLRAAVTKAIDPPSGASARRRVVLRAEADARYATVIAALDELRQVRSPRRLAGPVRIELGGCDNGAPLRNVAVASSVRVM